jgi:hypothetical protein
MRLEFNTNPWLMEKFAAEWQKLYDHKASTIPLFKYLKYVKNMRCMKWSSDKHMKLEWGARLLAFLLTLSIPLFINTFFFDPYEFNLLKGLVGYSTFVFIFLIAIRQKHRIDHISRLK